MSNPNEKQLFASACLKVARARDVVMNPSELACSGRLWVVASSA